MKTINYAYILLGITIFIMFVAIIVFANWNNIELTEPKIEQLRQEYLNEYSKAIKEVQEIIQEKTEQQEQLRQDIKELINSENQLKNCLWANSMTGAVVDCALYLNNNNNE